MKKIYLFLLLIVFSHSYCQFFVYTSNSSICETLDQNFGVNLTYNVSIADNSSEYIIGYFENQADAIANINAIPNPTSYPISTSQTFYVRVLKIQTNEIQYTSFNVFVVSSPTANPAVLSFCDQNSPLIYNLEDANAQIFGNQQGLSITYYDNPFSGGNVIVGGTFAPTIFPVQVLGAEVYDAATGCASPRTSITLNTNNCNPCPEPTAITATSITPYGATIGWTSSTAENYDIIILLSGSTAPTATSSGWVSNNTSLYSINFLLPGYCYDVYIRSQCNLESASDWAGPRTFCTLGCSDNGNCPDYLDLRAFLDSNSNGVKDAAEVAFNNGSFLYQVNNSGYPIPGYSNTDSFKIFDNNPLNLYDLNFTIDQGLEPYFSATTSYSNINIPEGSGSQIYYFPVTQLQPYQDLEVELIPNGAPPRPGFPYSNLIRYKNKGLEAIAAGTLNFVKDEYVSIISISQSGTINSANGFSYDFVDLAPNEERQINVVMQVPTIPTISLGQVLTSSVATTPLVGDSFPLSNTDDLAQMVVGSYDPNHKSEKHGGKIAIDAFTTSDYLTYTIQFENTGTANAEFVRIDDLLDAQLNLSSVVMGSSSHPVNLRKIDHKLIWNFYNINLPPTISDPLMSHGFVQFKVKPMSGFSVGTKILNFADIYFDYNPPIFTNVCETEFVETLSTDSFDANTIAMYPNPANTTLRIMKSNGLEKISSINVYDIVGKAVIIHSSIESSDVNLDVSRLNKGIYYVEITTNNQLKITKKLLIQ